MVRLREVEKKNVDLMSAYQLTSPGNNQLIRKVVTCIHSFVRQGNKEIYINLCEWRNNYKIKILIYNQRKDIPGEDTLPAMQEANCIFDSSTFFLSV